MLTQIFQNIIRSFKFYGNPIIFFLNFVITDLFRTVIRHCRGLDDNILLIASCGHCLKHISCSCHRNYLHKKWRCNRSRSAYQRDLRAPKHRHFCNGISHFSGRMISQTANRIYRLLRWPGSDEHFFAEKIFLKSNFFQDIFQKSLRFRHFSCACISAGKITTGRSNHFISIGNKFPDIILYNRIFIHGSIHGRRKNLLAPAGHNRCRKHIIGKAIGNFPNYIGTGRCNHYHICFLCNGNMLYLELKIPVKSVHQTFVSG